MRFERSSGILCLRGQHQAHQPREAGPVWVLESDLDATADLTPGDVHDSHPPHEDRRNVTAFTGTHDNDTVVGWFSTARARARATTSAASRRIALRYISGESSEINWDVINTPGQADGKQQGVEGLEAGALTDPLGNRLREMRATYGRLRRQ